MTEKAEVPETIVEYSVKIVKNGKNFYTYNMSVQPGGSKLETQSKVIPDPDGDKSKDVTVTNVVETNPGTKAAGQAMGIGQAMQFVNDIAYGAIENAGMVK